MKTSVWTAVLIRTRTSPVRGCLSLVLLSGCGVTDDGTSGAEQCSQAAAVQACPAGSVPRLDAASTAQCGGTAAGSFSQIQGVRTRQFCRAAVCLNIGESRVLPFVRGAKTRTSLSDSKLGAHT
jgi:hypothetical protein